MSPAPVRRAASGFTLIETILVIALIGILAALLLPSLGRFRAHAMEKRSLGNCRSHAQILTLYTSDFRDAWPALTSPTATLSIIRCASRNESFEAKYFDLCRAWNIGLADGYYAGRFDDPTFTTPWTTGLPSFTEYQFPCSFLADPKFFNAETEEFPPAQLRGTLASEVAFPSEKALVVATIDEAQPLAALGSPEIRFHLACVDGHARAIGFSQRGDSFGGDGVAAPSMSDHVGRLYDGPLHTLNGVAGRDLRR